MPLSTTFKTRPLISPSVDIWGTPAVTRYMTKSVALVAFGSTRTTRLNPSATPTPVTDTHTTTSVTNAQIQAMINEGVTAALAARDATRNGDDSH
ncbi:hypothetical protein Tco_1137406 [Tanacetum coccineum]